MYVRLAFAVAAHLEPQILIVDEVLAVGDAQFQKKCLGKMQDVARRNGRTVLFVSHNMQAISTLSTRCVMLREGRSAMEGRPETVIASYLADGASRDRVYEGEASGSRATITRIEVLTSEPNGTHIHGRPMQLRFDVNVPSPLRSGVFSFQIHNEMMQPIVHMWLFDAERPFCRAAGRHTLVCDIPRLRLYLGRYTVTAHISDGYRGGYFQTVESVCPFEVVMHGHERDWPWEEGTCQYLEEGRWDVLPLSAAPAEGAVVASV
jgi:lipopolysaccharide transport system ATP-binding protein